MSKVYCIRTRQKGKHITFDEREDLEAMVNQMITNKSTYKATNSSMYCTKEIHGKDVSPLIQTNAAEERFESCLNDAGFGTLQKFDIKTSKASISLPLNTDRYYYEVEKTLDLDKTLKTNKYDVKKYINCALATIMKDKDGIISELTHNELIDRILVYYTRKTNY